MATLTPSLSNFVLSWDTKWLLTQNKTTPNCFFFFLSLKKTETNLSFYCQELSCWDAPSNPPSASLPKNPAPPPPPIHFYCCHLLFVLHGFWLYPGGGGWGGGRIQHWLLILKHKLHTWVHQRGGKKNLPSEDLFIKFAVRSCQPFHVRSQFSVWGTTKEWIQARVHHSVISTTSHHCTLLISYK